MTTMEGRVSEGAKWMDRHVRGWVDRIDLQELSLSSCWSCVLGQINGDYYDLFLKTESMFGVAGMRDGVHGWDRTWANAHGFNQPLEAWGDDDMDRLRELWVTEILSRRFAEQAQPAPQPVAVESGQ